MNHSLNLSVIVRRHTGTSTASISKWIDLAVAGATFYDVPLIGLVVLKTEDRPFKASIVICVVKSVSAILNQEYGLDMLIYDQLIAN